MVYQWPISRLYIYFACIKVTREEDVIQGAVEESLQSLKH